MPSTDEIREAQRQNWNRSAPAWKKWEAEMRPWLGQVGRVLLERLGLADGIRLLDVACGTGEPGLTAARRIGSGQVVGVDLSEEMLAVAADNGRALGLSNYRTQAADAGELPFADASFDAVVCQFGAMLFPDPARAVREMVRVLAPGGRLALSCWAAADANPWMEVIWEPASAVLGLPPAPPDAPGMFRLAEPGSLRRLLEQAGATQVVEEAVHLEADFGSPEHTWQMMSEVAGGLARALEAATPEQRQATDRAVLDALRERAVGGRVIARGKAWVASGHR